jgi:hypothetical protein
MAISQQAPAYVRRLDARLRSVEAELAAVHDGLNELRAYLNSPKFRGDRGPLTYYVNIEDVLARLNDATYAGVVAADRALEVKDER